MGFGLYKYPVNWFNKILIDTLYNKKCNFAFRLKTHHGEYKKFLRYSAH